MKIEWPKSTNKGTALMRLAHQFQPKVIIKDPYVSWFFDDSLVASLQKAALAEDFSPQNEDERFNQIAYWYIILREKYIDDIINEAIITGCKQLVLLGAGFDTRFFRLSEIRKNAVRTYEIDLPSIIKEKADAICFRQGSVPSNLVLIPLDFNKQEIAHIENYDFNKKVKTAFIWQGVSYFLPKDTISSVLDFISSLMIPGSAFAFDSCSPLMTYKNNQIPGISQSIDRLVAIGEPYVFGIEANEMRTWLSKKGFQSIDIIQLDELERKLLKRHTLPGNMWYIVTAK
jgi:methyltransferase (TIGR00027 family)